VDLGEDKIVCEIVSSLKEGRPQDGAVKVDGTWGAFAPILAAHISKTLKRPILYVNAQLDEADRTSDDLQVFRGRGAEVFPVWEGVENVADATDEIGAQRLRLSLGLAQAEAEELSGLIICAPVQALNQPVAGGEVLMEAGLSLGVKQTIEPELVAAWLSDNGFERVDNVDVPGQFARRGGGKIYWADEEVDMIRRANLDGSNIEDLDGWMAPECDENGRLMADPKKFPIGMKAIGDYIHSRGLKYGIYQDRGEMTCQQLPGSLGHEQIDMETFAEWGVDYIKMDSCFAESNGRMSSEDYALCRKCIKAAGRPMVLSISDFGNGAWVAISIEKGARVSTS